MQHSISQGNTSSDAKLTRVLLLCGVVAGPLYILVGGIEMLTRPGFDPTRHDLSLMSNGDWGGIHSSLLILTGLLTIAGAVGMRRVLHGSRCHTQCMLHTFLLPLLLQEVLEHFTRSSRDMQPCSAVTRPNPSDTTLRAHWHSGMSLSLFARKQALKL